MTNNQLEAFIEAFRKATEMKPTVDFHEHLGIALGSAQRFQEAARKFRKAVLLDPIRWTPYAAARSTT